MNPSPSSVQSFIVKIWLEETTEEAGQALWRGHVTHAASGARQYLKNLDEVSVFIAPYLQRMGARLSWRWRARQWMRQRRWYGMKKP